MQLDEAEGGDPYDPDTWHCLFAVDPHVVGDAAATLARSEHFPLSEITAELGASE
jgi:hypothetical protein